MLVGERMSQPVISVDPSMPITEALNLMRSKNIRRVPVLKDGRLIGIVADKDVLNASPSQATSLSVWELNYLISKIAVEDIMTKKVFTVGETTPIEEAAAIMVDHKIGGLPVMRGDTVVGIITETDLFKIFLELLGAREKGVRVTALMPDRPGELAEFSAAMARAGGNFRSFGVFAGESPDNRLVTFKVADLNAEQVREIITPFLVKLVDIRTTNP